MRQEPYGGRRNASEHREWGEALSANVCTGCTGACCLDVIVGISGFDAWRIARANALAFEDFVTVATAEAGSPGAFRLGDGFGALVLARNANDARACTFLGPLRDGARRCETHPSRPRVCRSYPMARDGDVLVLRADVACGPNAWNMAAVTRDLWLRDLAEEASEWSRYERVVADWNSTGRDEFDAFLTFVQRACDERQ